MKIVSTDGLGGHHEYETTGHGIHWQSAMTPGAGCQYCGPYITHSGTCPHIKALEYYPDGTIKRVEFHSMTGGGPVGTGR